MSQSGALRFTGGGGGGTILTLTGNSGGPVGPDGFGDINVIGDGTTITVAGNPGTSTLTISVLGSVAIQFTADDANVATPVGGNLNIFGGPNINTTVPAGNTIQVNLDESILLPATNGPNQGVIALGVNLTTDRFIHATGIDNTFLGRQSGSFAVIGSNNTGVGSSSLNQLFTGDGNAAIGFESLSLVDSGADNTAIGRNSLPSITSGDSNTALGVNSGTGFVTGTESSNIVIRNNGINGESNTIRIGTQGGGFGQQDKAYMAGIYQTTPGATNEVGFVGNDGKLGTRTLNDGQIIIGDTGSSPVIANITSADNTVTITNGAGSIDLSTNSGIAYTVTTNNAVATTIATFALPNDSAWTFSLDVVTARNDYAFSMHATGIFGARKDGANPPVITLSNINGPSGDSPAATFAVTAVAAATVDIQVTGVAGETWNWKAVISTIKLP